MIYPNWEKNVESAKEELDAFEEAEGELMKIEKDLQAAEAVTYPNTHLLFVITEFCFNYCLWKLVQE